MMTYETKQQMFDAVARHLLTQNQKCHDAEGVHCAYRGPNGLKCAIGALIPDDVYTSEMEGFTASALRSKLDADLGDRLPWPKKLDGFAGLLQKVHDEGLPEQWRDRLRSLATVHKLDTAVLDEVK